MQAVGKGDVYDVENPGIGKSNALISLPGN